MAGAEAPPRGKASAAEVGVVGLDPAQNVFQAQGAGADGAVVLGPKPARAQLPKLPGGRSRGVVAMEARAIAHRCDRVIGDLGHDVRPIPPPA
jgi:hypothetical protein